MRDTYVYGPVPSRRLGRSLGVDVIPGASASGRQIRGLRKFCTLDCVYCQLGPTGEKTIERKDYVPVEALLDELKQRLQESAAADFITISGSGEPTLNSRLGEIIDGIKQITDIPVAVLTNGTLLYRQDVRADCAKADLVIPSLDAGDEQTFRKVNRPHKDISIEKLISGLCEFRNEFAGRIWLEVFLLEGLNTDAGQIAKIKALIQRIRPDKVQLNTAVRPTAEPNIHRVNTQKLKAIAAELGQNCEAVSGYCPDAEPFAAKHKLEAELRNMLLSMLKRRPCSVDDVCSAFGMHRNEILKYLGSLQAEGIVDSVEKNGKVFFKALS